MKSAVVSVAWAVLGLLPLLPADELHLADGRVIEGDLLVTPDPGDVAIRTRFGGLTAVLHLKAAEIVTISYGPTAQQRQLASFEGKRAALARSGATVEQWWELAEEGLALGEKPAARQIAQRILDLDEAWAPARALLGQVLQDGQWMTRAEAAVARGEVFFRGRWVQVAQRDGMLEEEARTAREAGERAAQRRAVRGEELELARKAAAVQAMRAAASTRDDVPGISIYRPGWSGGLSGSRYDDACHEQRSGWPNISFLARGQGHGFQWGLSIR